MSVLRIRDPDTGQWQVIRSLRGEPGKSPIIQDGYWWIYDNDAGTYVPTDTPASGAPPNMDTLEQQAHTHANKTELDKIQPDDKAKWDAMPEALKSWVQQQGYGTGQELVDAVQLVPINGGTRLSIGDAAADIMDGQDGEQGPAGYSPTRGVDYWTAADVQEITAAANQLPAPEFVDTLAEMTDPSKMYVLTSDGNIYGYQTGTGAGYTNLFDPTSAQINTRMGSSGSTKADNGYVFLADIPIALRADTSNPVLIRIKGAAMSDNASIGYYPEGQMVSGKIYQQYPAALVTVADDTSDVCIKAGYNADGFYSNIADSGRVCLSLAVSPGTAITAEDIQDIIITIDEPIAEGGAGAWVSRGVYQAASYEPRVLALEHMGLRLSGNQVQLVRGSTVMSSLTLPLDMVGYVGTGEDANIITLASALPAGTYTLRYIGADGYTPIGTLEVP